MRLLHSIASLMLCASLHATDVLTALGPFGIGSCHIHNRSAQDAAHWVPQMQAIGLRYYRSTCTGWSQVEPEQGKFDWKALDAHSSYLKQHGFIFGGLLNGGVKWNTLDKPGTLPVNNLPAWSNYVFEVVKHSKDDIKRWEIWNEPPNGTGRDQSAADYAMIVIAAYDAAKKADPNCLIGIAAKSAHINYLEKAIQAGAKDHFDYITLHPYEVLDGIASNKGTESVFLHIVPTLRKMLRAQNPAKADVPVVFTELGCDAVKKGADSQAHALVKAYTMGIAQGVECIQWFEGKDGDSGPLGLLDRKGTPRPAYGAMARMIEHLGQHPKYLGWTLLNDKHYAFAFQGSKKTILITWAYRGGKDELLFPQPIALLNPINGDLTSTNKLSITQAPVLILDVPESLLVDVEANKLKPLTWGGDYSKSESVSITMDGQQIEHGLHTLSGEAVAGAVVAYGGSARAGNIPGGNVFIADPEFLSYTPTPIEITAVVRRNENNDNAGFKLVYESTSGLKTAKSGWFTVPDNKQWHTVRWRIDDAQFVNYWGHNFALESDGNQFNRYYLQSVTVTKRSPTPN